MKADRKSHAEKAAEKIMKAPPGAVKRLGAKVFLKVPLYRAKRQYKVAYINLPLFQKLFAPKGRVSHAEAAQIVQRLFNTTIEKDHSTGEKIGTAYCDRQYDPLGLSLSGNLGSGRAYYVGKCFNIKGEKTPLATSDQRRFSDGLLEMERAMWETTVANALQGSISTGLNNVLAILDMSEECKVLWREESVHRAKIIRVDENGELDRITHLFHAGKPVGKKALLDCAKSYGVLEADKFAERILHGSWSPGNISLKGHLIDFDTVCAMKGRTPQYSFTRWHYQNRFGFEIHGQLEILKAMAADKKLNKDKVPFDDLREAAFASLRERLTRRFLGLMGFRDDDKTVKAYAGELQQLTDLWSELSRKTFKRPQDASVKLAASLVLHVFDFSAFFRTYPLQARGGAFDPAAAVRMLCGNGFQKEKPGEKLTLPVQFEFTDKLNGVIGEHYIATPVEMQMMQIAALQFVKLYDRLYQRILADTGAKPGEVEARAYVVNEDRAYMFPPQTPTYALAQSRKPFPPEVLQELMEANIRAGRRATGESGGEFVADIRLYREGFAYHLLDGKGHFQLGFHFFAPRDLKAIQEISIKSKKFKVMERKGRDLLTAKMDNFGLTEGLDVAKGAAMALIPKKGSKKIGLKHILTA